MLQGKDALSRTNKTHHVVPSSLLPPHPSPPPAWIAVASGGVVFAL